MIVNPFDIDAGATTNNPSSRLNMLLSMYKHEYSWTVRQLSHRADVSEKTARKWSKALVDIDAAMKVEDRYCMTNTGVLYADKILLTYAKQSAHDGFYSYVRNHSYGDTKPGDFEFESDVAPREELIRERYERETVSIDDII